MGNLTTPGSYHSLGKKSILTYDTPTVIRSQSPLFWTIPIYVHPFSGLVYSIQPTKTRSPPVEQTCTLPKTNSEKTLQNDGWKTTYDPFFWGKKPTSWWFQPIRKTFLRLDHFPR